MKININNSNMLYLLISIIFIIVIIGSFYYIYNINDNDFLNNEISNQDFIPPTIESITKNIEANAGSNITILAIYSDNEEISMVKIYYRPKDAIRWSSKSISNGTVNISLPLNDLDEWYYYVVVDDKAGNGPVGDPSVDGSIYYTITVLDSSESENDSNNDSSNDNEDYKNFSRPIFLEVGTKIVCSECPDINSVLEELYSEDEYNFYYVSMPMENQKAKNRLNDYNIWGYPTIYFDGGYETLIGSNNDKSDIIEKIVSSSLRSSSNLSIDTSSNLNENQNTIDLVVNITNYENQVYDGTIRIYLTEIISTIWKGDHPYRFAFLDFIVNESISVPAQQKISIMKSYDISMYDPDNLLLFSVVFSSEKHQRFSQPPDNNPFNAYFVDAVAKTSVVESGNLPPEVGIQSPLIKYFHFLGEPKRKSLFGKTVLIGQTNIIASATDDSNIESVEFYINNNLVAEFSEEPFEWNWHNFTFGKRTIMIKAYDDNGKTATATMDVFVIMKWPGFFTKQ